LGYGKGYAYDHDAPDGFSGQNYFPDTVARADLYQPKEKGLEAKVKERVAHWRRLRAERGE
jgi:putative ATPase